jgi:putative transposase
VAAETHNGRDLLPAQERVFVADAAPRVPYGRQTVYYHFRKWRLDGRLRRAHDRLRDAVREAQGRDHDPSATVIDSQIVKTTPVGGPERGYDGAKRLAGRKRHILVDTSSGLVLAARAHGADLPDRDGGRRLLEDGKACRGWSCSGPTAHTRADFASGCGTGWGGAWKCHTTRTGSCGATGWRISRAVSRCCLAVGSWTWSAPSRTFAWLGLSRRFSKDYERLPETAEAMIYGAMSRLMVRRLARAA